MHIRQTIHTEDDLKDRFGLRFLERWQALLRLYRKKYRMMASVNVMKVASVAFAFFGTAVDGNSAVGEHFDEMMHDGSMEIEGESFVVAEEDDCRGVLMWDIATLMLEEHPELVATSQYAWDVADEHVWQAYNVINEGMAPVVVTVTQPTKVNIQPVKGESLDQDTVRKMVAVAMSTNDVTTCKAMKDIVERSAEEYGCDCTNEMRQLRKHIDNLNGLTTIQLNINNMNETYQTKYHNEFHPNSNPTINQDCTFDGPVYQGCGQQAQVQHFPLCREDVYLKKLYMFLINKEWIEGSTHPDNFVYLMGGLEHSPMVKPIVWNLSAQLLREMLEMVFEPVIKRGVIKKADLERIAPVCFSREGKPAILPATKHRDCQEYDLLVNFLASIA